MVPFDASAFGSSLDLPGGSHFWDWPTRKPFHPPAVSESLDHAAREDFPVVESSNPTRPRCGIYGITHDQITGRPTSDELDMPQSLGRLGSSIGQRAASPSRSERTDARYGL